jgi:hypothetical protein
MPLILQNQEVPILDLLTVHSLAYMPLYYTEINPYYPMNVSSRFYKYFNQTFTESKTCRTIHASMHGILRFHIVSQSKFHKGITKGSIEGETYIEVRACSLMFHIDFNQTVTKIVTKGFTERETYTTDAPRFLHEDAPIC